MTHIETQKQSIADYLNLGLTLNPLEAMKLFGCSKLSTRCGELEKANKVPFLYRTRIEVKTRFGKTYVVQYTKDDQGYALTCVHCSTVSFFDVDSERELRSLFGDDDEREFEEEE